MARQRDALARFPALSIAATALGIALAPHSAHAIDCTKAQEPIERAVCGDPAAKAADDAMGIAFRSLLGKLSAQEKEVVLDDQRAWIASRNRHCQSHRLPPASCARERAEERIAVLSGRPETGPGLAGNLQPHFLRRQSESEKFEFQAQLYRFATPKSAGERLLNREADASVKLFDETTKELLDYRKEAPNSGTFSYHETWTLRYASPAFLSIWKEEDQYSGGAHPIGGASGLNIDLRNGRILTFADLFEKEALKPISRLCLKDIERRSGERLSDLDIQEPGARAEATVGRLTSWTFRENEAEIVFNIGALGDTYAAGSFRCSLPLTALNPLAKVPLPPR